jgi:preprotein translocase subunit SecF
VLAGGAGGQFLEVVPIVDDFVAAGPAFFEVVEDGLSGVVVASPFLVLLVLVVFETAVALAPLLALFTHY